jgi:hypothetical protein
VVCACVVALLSALAVRYPASFEDANRAARANAELDYLDRELGGGNSVLPDQSIAIEARGRIPPDETFAVQVGTRRLGWSALTTQGAVDTYLRYFLLPRRSSETGRWVICLACNRAAYPDATLVWQDAEEGVSILRRPA